MVLMARETEIREEGRMEGRAEGRKEGRMEGRAEEHEMLLTTNVKNLMQNLKMSAAQAMDVLNVSAADRPRITELITRG